MRNSIKLGVLVASLAGLVACGGGGGGDSSSPTNPGADPTPTPNTAPVAKAGLDKNVSTGSQVQVSGAESTDADGDQLTYQWTMASRPAGSAAVLDDATLTAPKFTPDVDGKYVLELIVSDGKLQSVADSVTITAATANSAPVANAGVDQNVETGTEVNLSGSKSSDANGDPLTYRWSLTSTPAGSAAALSSVNTVSTKFTADVDGVYVAELIVNDGKLDSVSDTVSITASTSNSVPVANAGVDIVANTGSLITLDGSKSSDTDGDQLTYAWSWQSKPTNSTAQFSDANVVSPKFTVDVDGTYVALLVVNDGKADSAADSVTITASTANSAPVANAGADQNVETGTLVTLSGVASSDVDGDQLSYRWSMSSAPTGSSAVLDSTNTAVTKFTADVDGVYVAQLIVNDGKLDSVADTVSVTASTSNSAPVANAGADQNVKVGNIVYLDGSGSTDADNDGLSYNWSFVSKPTGSSADFDDNTASNPSFTADIEGAYVINLVVNDGLEDSTVDTVKVDAIQPRVRLYKAPDFWGGSYSEIQFPYSTNGAVNAQVSGVPTPTTYSLGKFKLLAEGEAFTIQNVSATDSTGKVVPFFKGLAENDEIADGSEIIFELISPLTRGATVNVNFTFEIKETAEVFSASYSFKSN